MAKLTLRSCYRSQEQAIISGGVRRFHGEHVSLKLPSEILLGLRSEGEEKAQTNPASRGRGNPGPHPEAPQAWSNAQARLLRRSETDICIETGCACLGTGSPEVSAGLPEPTGVSYNRREPQRLLHLGPYSEPRAQAQKWNDLPFQVGCICKYPQAKDVCAARMPNM